MTTNDNETEQQVSTFYSCIKCSYNTVRKSNYDRHVLSARHIKTTNDNKFEKKASNRYNCAICNKHHNDRAGLWRHNQKCKEPEVKESGSSSDDKDALILTLVKQNTELIKETSEVKTMMLEMLKKGTHHTTTNNNNTFNLNVFLNETCKDAMNIEDFISSIKWQLSDLDMVSKLGFIKGVSKLVIDKSNLMEEHKRPFHCTDAKREVMYVKDDDKWEKECNGNPKMRNVVKRATHHRLVLPAMAEFRTANPEYSVSDSDISTKYQRIMTEALCGGISDDEHTEAEKENIIIKNISKGALINKSAQ
jgi:hypothetical protein